ncbi:MAG: type II toxin-antitoxin system Phd/YefM family antitoxin [Planctomycetes bacterium]|nr:type II toxin-antitoxin system Phd/YefM family antitoxin [Planctomycetota bacterium]
MEGAMTETLTISQARNEFLRLPKRLGGKRGVHAVTVTQHGKPVMTILPAEFYETLVETLEILGDREQMASIRRGIRELKAGKRIPLEDLKADLGL